MQRIIAGAHRGRRLLDLPASLQGVRPTGAKVRGAIFDRLQGDVLNANFLDLFAGSGAMSFEALSRGAARATLVERDKRVHRFLQRQIDTLGLGERCELVLADAQQFVQRPRSGTYDLVFVDPPYAEPGLYAAVVEPLREGGWLAASATVVFERDNANRDAVNLWPRGYELTAQRRYGQTAVDFLAPANR
ncbi:MAG: 16S rRNA (guanine(966)-N(2))-methyltransferase RsmD [Myxococcales bacterium FL481]|nr:MAG: 16S rRNA (guanine(966)-N(2))-methyltransferase RsmD [Myxococcales bacterium FL481]